MGKYWLEAIKITGAVGVVAFLVYKIVGYIYSEKIVDQFGSDKMFVLTVGIVSAVFLILLVAVLKHKYKVDVSDVSDVSDGKEKIKRKEGEGPKVLYKDSSIHKGDNNF